MVSYTEWNMYIAFIERIISTETPSASDELKEYFSKSGNRGKPNPVVKKALASLKVDKAFITKWEVEASKVGRTHNYVWAVLAETYAYQSVPVPVVLVKRVMELMRNWLSHLKKETQPHVYPRYVAGYRKFCKFIKQKPPANMEDLLDVEDAEPMRVTPLLRKETASTAIKSKYFGQIAVDRFFRLFYPNHAMPIDVVKQLEAGTVPDELKIVYQEQAAKQIPRYISDVVEQVIGDDTALATMAAVRKFLDKNGLGVNLAFKIKQQRLEKLVAAQKQKNIVDKFRNGETAESQPALFKSLPKQNAPKPGYTLLGGGLIESDKTYRDTIEYLLGLRYAFNLAPKDVYAQIKVYLRKSKNNAVKPLAAITEAIRRMASGRAELNHVVEILSPHSRTKLAHKTIYEALFLYAEIMATNGVKLPKDLKESVASGIALYLKESERGDTPEQYKRHVANMKRMCAHVGINFASDVKLPKEGKLPMKEESGLKNYNLMAAGIIPTFREYGQFVNSILSMKGVFGDLTDDDVAALTKFYSTPATMNKPNDKLKPVLEPLQTRPEDLIALMDRRWESNTTNNYIAYFVFAELCAANNLSIAYKVKAIIGKALISYISRPPVKIDSYEKLNRRVRFFCEHTGIDYSSFVAKIPKADKEMLTSTAGRKLPMKEETAGPTKTQIEFMKKHNKSRERAYTIMKLMDMLTNAPPAALKEKLKWLKADAKKALLKEEALKLIKKAGGFDQPQSTLLRKTGFTKWVNNNPKRKVFFRLASLEDTASMPKMQFNDMEFAGAELLIDNYIGIKVPGSNVPSTYAIDELRQTVLPKSIREHLVNPKVTNNPKPMRDFMRTVGDASMHGADSSVDMVTGAAKVFVMNGIPAPGYGNKNESNFIAQFAKAIKSKQSNPKIFRKDSHNTVAKLMEVIRALDKLSKSK